MQITFTIKILLTFCKTTRGKIYHIQVFISILFPILLFLLLLLLLLLLVLVLAVRACTGGAE